jgi:hypothetical protein
MLLLLAWVSGPPSPSLRIAVVVRSYTFKRLAADAGTMKIPRIVAGATPCSDKKIRIKSLPENKNVIISLCLHPLQEALI